MIVALGLLLIFSVAAVSETGAAEISGGSPKARPRAAKPEREENEQRDLELPFRDSEVIYRNVVSARSFNRSADLTYNPYYAMELEIAPVFWLSKRLYAGLDISLVRELTNSDTTTKQGEVVLQDIYLALGAPKIATIPVLKIDVTPTVRFYTPSSKISQARTLILAIRPRIGLSRRIDVLGGLTFSYGISLRGNFHESTTAVSEAPVVPDAIGSTRSQESFTNLGTRNTRLVLSNSFGMSLGFTKRVGIELMAAVIHGFLYDLTIDDERISYEPQEPTDVRYLMAYTGEVWAEPLSFLVIALGFITENIQLAQSSTYEAPFFNRYTAVFLDLRVDAAALTKKLTSKRGRK